MVRSSPFLVQNGRVLRVFCAFFKKILRFFAIFFGRFSIGEKRGNFVKKWKKTANI